MLIVFVLGVAVRWWGTQRGMWIGAAAAGAVYGAGAVLLLCARESDPRRRWAWRVLGLGVLAFGSGDLLTLCGLDRPLTSWSPSPAFVCYLLWYPLAYAAVVLALGSRTERFRVGIGLDGAVAVLGVSAMATAVVGQRFADRSGEPTLWTTAGAIYPAVDVMLVVIVLAGGGLRLPPGDGGGAGPGWQVDRSLRRLVVGLTLFAAADTIYLPRTMDGSYVEGGWLDVGWLLGVLALSLAGGNGHDSPGPRSAAWARPLTRLLARRAGRDPEGEQSARGGTSPVADSPRPTSTGSPRRPNSVRHRMKVLSALSALIALGIIIWGQVGTVPVLSLALADTAALVAFVRLALSFREARAGQARRLAVLHRQARTDELTGLPNRLALQEHCHRMLDGVPPGGELSLLLLDLDGFREINDALGHACGDALLVQISRRLRTTVDLRHLVARIGGDEFAVLLEATGRADAIGHARILRSTLATPLLIDDLRVHLNGSIGIATAPHPATNPAELLRFADMAAHTAKQTRTPVVVFDADSVDATPERLRTLEELRGALSGADPTRNGYFVIHLQPQLRLTGPLGVGEIAGFEALVRWNHPVRGLLMPGQFLPLVEAAGLLAQLAEAVLDLALAACARWWTAGRHVPVSVNLSAGEIHDHSLPERVAVRLSRHQLPGQALVLELTEQALVTDQVQSRTILQSIRDLGIAVSIDDYGTGYSSLAYLRNLPVDELKLDRTFTTDLATDPTASAIIRTTVDLAHSLGLRLVAEGIEDDRAVTLLVDHGCDLGQGYHLAYPMPVPQALTWLERHTGAALTRSLEHA